MNFLASKGRENKAPAGAKLDQRTETNGESLEALEADDEGPPATEAESLEAARERVHDWLAAGGLEYAADEIEKDRNGGTLTDDAAGLLEAYLLSLIREPILDRDQWAAHVLASIGRAVPIGTPEEREQRDRDVASARARVASPAYRSREKRQALISDIRGRATKRRREREQGERGRQREADCDSLESFKADLRRAQRETPVAGEETACGFAELRKGTYSEHGVHDLEDLTRLVGGRQVHRSFPTYDALALAHAASQRGLRWERFDDLAASLLPELGPTLKEWDRTGSRCWFMLVDNGHTAPPDLRATTLPAWAAGVRKSLPSDLRDHAIGVHALPGEPPIVTFWCPDGWGPAEVAAYARKLSGTPSEGQRARFEPASDPVWVPPGVYLPALHASPVAASFAARRTVVLPGSVRGTPTGVPALDRILLDGLPPNAVVCVAGDTGHGKTTLAHEAIENLAAAEPDSLSLYLTLDDPDLKIRVRRLQKRCGLSRAEAEAALGTTAEGAIQDEVEVVCLGDDLQTFEDVLGLADRIANGRQINLVIDSIQNLPTRGGEGRSENGQVLASSKAVRAAVLVPRRKLRVLFTSELVQGSGHLKGSGSLKYDVDLVLVSRLNEAGDRLTVDVRKNKIRAEGVRERTSFVLGLDQSKQRIFDPSAPKAKSARRAAERDTELWPLVRDALPVKSKRQLQRKLRVSPVAVSACLDAHEKTGDVVKVGRGYALA